MRPRVLIDVSRLLDVGITSGIQRVVRQVVPRLVAAPDLDVVLIGWDRTRLVWEVFDTASAVACLQGADGLPEQTGTREVGEFHEGEIFLDLDAVWSSTLKRSTLYPLIKQAGGRIVSFVYDTVPLAVPRSVAPGPTANWAIWFAAVLTYADLVLADSRSAERDLLAWKERFGVERDLPTLVTRLGADLPDAVPPTPEELASVEEFSDAPYVLFVGTVEPRKRHLLALEAFDQVAATHPDLHLVLAGRAWKFADAISKQIREHADHGARVHRVDAPSDALLVELYRRATATFYFSRYEGFGLPIAESLGHGKITIASRNSSMYEVGREATDYTWVDSPAEIAGTLAGYLDDPELRRAREAYVRETFQIVGWDTVAETITQAVRSLHETATGAPRRYEVIVTHELIRTPDAAGATLDALDHGGFELLGYDPDRSEALPEDWADDARGWLDAHPSVDLDPRVAALNHAVTRHPAAFRKRFDIAVDELADEARDLRAREGLGQPMTRFPGADGSGVYVSGLPTLLVARAGGSVVVEASVQAVGTTAEVRLGCGLGEDVRALAAGGSGYRVGLVRLTVPAPAEPGRHPVTFTVRVGGRFVEADRPPRAELLVLGDGDDLEQVWRPPQPHTLWARLKSRMRR